MRGWGYLINVRGKSVSRFGMNGSPARASRASSCGWSGGSLRPLLYLPPPVALIVLSMQLALGLWGSTKQR